MAPTAWLELSVAAEQEAAEAIAELLARYGYNGGVTLEARPEPGLPLDEAGVPTPLESDPTYPVILRTYLPLDEQAEEKRQQIAQALWHLGRLRPIGALHTQMVAEEDWANVWKRFYSVQRIGTRTVIVPSWLEHTPQPDDIVLHLDPGMAFGTGLHPTTRLCLERLETEVRPGMRMLDLGTGSGILAIAAARQGAAPVLALDTDPIAIEATHANIARNGLADQITATVGSLPLPSSPAPASLPAPPYDLIVANIIAAVLIELAPALASALAPGGRLISSGIIQEREDEVALAFALAGLRLAARHGLGDWVALTHS